MPPAGYLGGMTVFFPVLEHWTSPSLSEPFHVSTTLLSTLGTILPLVLAAFAGQINTEIQKGESWLQKLSAPIQALIFALGASLLAYLASLLNVDLPASIPGVTASTITTLVTGILTYLATHHTATTAKAAAATAAQVKTSALTTQSVVTNAAVTKPVIIPNKTA